MGFAVCPNLASWPQGKRSSLPTHFPCSLGHLADWLCVEWRLGRQLWHLYCILLRQVWILQLPCCLLLGWQLWRWFLLQPGQSWLHPADLAAGVALLLFPKGDCLREGPALSLALAAQPNLEGALIGLLILLTMAGFGATLPHKNGISEPWLVAAIFGITLTSIVSLVTFALVLKLWCTINYTYRILPYVPTRTLLIIATLQCVASVVFASAGGFLLFLQYRGLHSQSGEASGENDLAASLTAGSLLYSLSYAALSLSFYLFAWILRKYSAQLAKESSAKALLEVSRESRVDDMSAISSEQ
jgi:hypothetical protein